MEEVKLNMWKSARKVVKHKLVDQVAELKDDRPLFALFAMDGTLLP